MLTDCSWALVTAKTAHSPAYPTKTTRNGVTETIGDRLRKRRRTESSRPEGSPPSPQRAQLGQVGATIGFQEQIRPTYHAATKNAQGKVTEGIHDSAQGPRLDSPPGVDIPTVPQQLSAGDHPTEGPSAPDFNTVIADIINHGETVDNHYATRGFDDFSMLANGHFQHISASFTLKTQSLPVLENLVSFCRDWYVMGSDVPRLRRSWRSWRDQVITKSSQLPPNPIQTPDKLTRH